MKDQFYQKGQFLKEMLKDTYNFFKTGKHKGAKYKPFGYNSDITHILNAGLICFFNIKSTEFSLQKEVFNGKTYLCLAICGSNDAIDWIMNVDIRTVPMRDSKIKKWHWFKWSGWWEARRIAKVLKKVDTFNLPLLMVVHSKSAATAPPLLIKLRSALKQIPVEHVYNFCPARCVRTPYKIGNMTIFLDFEDSIPELGKPFLMHPLCAVMLNYGFTSNPHSLSNFDYYFDKMLEIENL